LPFSLRCAPENAQRSANDDDEETIAARTNAFDAIRVVGDNGLIDYI